MVSVVRLLRWLGPSILVVGLSILALGVARGEARVYLVLIVPVVVGTGLLAFAAILLVFLGFFLTVFLWPARLAPLPDEPAVVPSGRDDAQPTRRWGGVAFLGPIPIVFGSDPRMTRTMLLLGVVLFLALLALTLFALLA